MTKDEAAIITAYTGILIGNFGEFHKYAEKLMERPIYTHELASRDLWVAIKHKAKNDFLNLKVEE